MIIALQNKKENIAEYILYIWQLEDLIRAWNFDLSQFQKNIIDQYMQPSIIKEDMKNWYADLINRMQNEGVKEKGHCSLTLDYIEKLQNIHDQLLENLDDIKYNEVYNWAKPVISDFKKALDIESNREIILCFEALHSFMMLNLKKENLNFETIEGIKNIRNLIALLSKRFSHIYG